MPVVIRHSIALLTCLFVSNLRGDAVLDWTGVMVNAIRMQNSAPTLASRNLAILHTAMYDAVNTATRKAQPYRFLGTGPTGTDPEAAATAAGYFVIKDLYPIAAPIADELYNNYVSSAPATAAVADGLVLGGQAALQAIQARISDGSTRDVPYVPIDEPGEWRRTPPFFRPPVDPQWRYVVPFCLPDIEPFVPLGPPALESDDYVRDFNLTKEYGGVESSVRTADQTEIARFWSDFSFTATPPGHWHEIAMGIARTQTKPLEENARLFALMSLAQADGAIVSWESKYRHNFWRPATAITRADLDNNPMTMPDTNWVSLLGAPSFPEYTSGHSTFSKASATILGEFYGTDAFSFSVTSDSLPGVFRHFTSLSACAEEIGMSRIYGGIHFMMANIDGKKCGDEIARYVLGNYLQPTNKLPSIRLEATASGAKELRVHGHIPSECVVEYSVDLREWSAIATNSAVIGGVALSFSNASVGNGFYRVRER
jgi:hypothetical protein